MQTVAGTASCSNGTLLDEFGLMLSMVHAFDAGVLCS